MLLFIVFCVWIEFIVATCGFHHWFGWIVSILLGAGATVVVDGLVILGMLIVMLLLEHNYRKVTDMPAKYWLEQEQARKK